MYQIDGQGSVRSATVRIERETLGLSMRDLAALAGISYPTISRIENGHARPVLSLDGPTGALPLSAHRPESATLIRLRWRIALADRTGVIETDGFNPRRKW